ncbi:efflux RND transporter permease subunit [Pseudonocardia asaccharolytica]|uniref:Cation transporter n=1 Tax=Pseudonocardia asaccharolytica DSM 44247 = NBRC 16224 TaxID=1123024 RepID=A0A511D561_9PSEU|nr:efflux RND transporter permease subunit [Pseudonocardia asaccharolytica]GEL19911.1 cation transporter [Pseudonocardia asaccharolytica DSM 44247 = NBRC 16224]
MLRWAVQTSITFRLLIVALAAGVLALGVIQFQNTRMNALPEFSPPYVEVQTEALGLSAEEVEQLITVPLEQDLFNSVAFLDEIRSDSVPGLSSIVMIFEPGTDLYRARQLVSERLTQTAALPNVSKSPVMLEPVSSASRALVLGMSSQQLSLIEQSVLARWTIKPRLLGVPGVSNVSVFGQRERQLQVQVDPAELEAKGVGLQDVISTTGNATWASPLTFLEASTPGTGGFIDTPNQRLSVQNVSPIVDARSLAQVAVEGHPGLRLGDVATVVEDHQLLIGDGIVGDTSGLMIVIEKFPDANTVEVTRGVEAALRELAPGLGDVRIDATVYRPASFVETAMRNLGLTLLIGVALALLLIGLFLFSWRTAVIAIVTIPLAVATAVVVLDLFGVTMNLLVVLGLVAALVVVIDDAVRDPEAIAGRLADRRTDGAANGSRTAAIVRGAFSMRRPAIYATLIVALAVVPVFFVPGSPGAFVAPLAVAYLIGLASAMLVALLVIPALASFLAARGGAHREAPVVRRLQRGYDRLGGRAVPRARSALVAAIVVVVTGAAMLPLLSTSLMPTLRESDLLITFDGSAGVSRPEMARVTAAAGAELRALPGVDQVGAHVGRALQSDQVADVDAGEIWVHLDPAADHDATVAAVQEIVSGYPGLERAVQTYLGEQSGTVLSSPDSELVVRVYGEDSAVLNTKADEVVTLLSGVDGLQNATVQRAPLRPTLQVEVDLAKAQQFNIKPGDVRRTIATLLAGLEAGSVFEEQKVFEVIVWGTPELRHSLASVQNLLVDRPDGAGQVRVGDVANVRIVPAAAVIHRDSSSRFLDVTATVAGRSYGAVEAEVREKLSAVAFPFEHRAEIVGDYAARQAAMWQIIGVAAVALVLIYLLLQAATRSWWLALVFLATLPVALAGGAIATAIGGGVVSLGTLMGLLTIAALSLKLTLSLTGEFQELRAAGEEAGPQLVRRVVRERLGPIVTSTIAIALAVLPIVIAGPVAGLELLHPMAVTVLGGLVTTTLLVLWVIPGLYAARAGRQEEDLELTTPAVRGGEDTGEELVAGGTRT